MDMKKSGKTGVISKKKKKKHAWLPQLNTRGLEIPIDRAARMVMTFFFFGEHSYFSFAFCISNFAWRIKSRSASQRPAFVKK